MKQAELTPYSDWLAEQLIIRKDYELQLNLEGHAKHKHKQLQASK